MNAKTRTLMALVALVLTFSLPLSGQSTSAQSSCKKAIGNLSEVATGNFTTGAVTGGGILNGTIESVFTSGGLPTPDPTTFSYTRDFTITTNQGQLKTRIVGMGDFSTGLATEIGRINPATSTGRFAGATGVIFTSGKSTDGFATIQFEITGEICFANE